MLLHQYSPVPGAVHQWHPIHFRVSLAYAGPDDLRGVHVGLHPQPALPAAVFALIPSVPVYGPAAGAFLGRVSGIDELDPLALRLGLVSHIELKLRIGPSGDKLPGLLPLGSSLLLLLHPAEVLKDVDADAIIGDLLCGHTVVDIPDKPLFPAAQSLQPPLR